MASRPIITLTTDFGHADHYVGVLKGVILGINPEATLVDLCHEVRSHDILDGAYTLAQGYRYFPPGTIHVVIIDPGVGSARRPILVRASAHHFVAPDNGVLSFVYQREPEIEVRHITAERYFLHPVSQTFHGRDIFSPVAAWLSRGEEPKRFGEAVTDYVKLTPPQPRRVDGRRWKGVTLHIDKFGNIITNITPADVPELFSDSAPGFRIVVNQYEITRLYPSYSQGKPSEIFAILGSSGYLEIATNRGSAAEVLGVGRGAEVNLELE